MTASLPTTVRQILQYQGIAPQEEKAEVDPSGVRNLGGYSRAIEFANNGPATSAGSNSPNLIAHFGKGITLAGTTTNSNLAVNRFVDVDLPIDLGNDGVTPSDPDDVDSGPNNRQNFPVLTLAQRGADSLLVQGTLDRPAGNASMAYAITLYASTDCTASGHGPGQRQMGSRLISLANGNSEAFSKTLSGIEPLAVGTAITAIATDTSGNSSELSAGKPSLKLRLQFYAYLHQQLLRK